MNPTAPREMIQTAYVVKDLQESMQEWIELLHAGPFYLLKGGFETDKLYRGNTTADTYTGAVGFRGDLIIELIQPLNDAPSIFREVLGTERSKLHHVHHLRGFTPREYDAEIEMFAKRGFGLAYSARVPGMGRAAFVDTYRHQGFFVELMETPPAVFDALETIRAAHTNWDGSEPIRTFPAIFAR
jgi:hypothetical protein